MADPKAYYLRRKARMLAKEHHPPLPKPKAAGPFRPITGQRKQRLPHVGQVKHPGRSKIHRRRNTVPTLFRLDKKEKIQWQTAANELEMPLVVLVRIAMRMLLSSNRRIKQITSGQKGAWIVKRVSRRTLERRVLKSFGVPYKETTEYVQPKAKSKKDNQATRPAIERGANPDVAGHNQRHAIRSQPADAVGRDAGERLHTENAAPPSLPARKRLMIVPSTPRP